MMKGSNYETDNNNNGLNKAPLTNQKSKAKNRKGKEIKTPLDKRIFDVLVSGTAILFLSPLFLIIMIAIKLEDKGPAVYLSKRVGSGYRIFNLIKFRSMYTDADKRLEQMKKNPFKRVDSEKMTDIEKMDKGFNGKTYSI
ncbi:MAG: sugar transferase, partial [Bacteroidia bacterium]